MRTFTRVANMSPGLRDTGDEIDAAHINELQQAAEDLQTGALPIALAGIEGALGDWEYARARVTPDVSTLTADNIPAINQALQDVKAAGGGVVTLPTHKQFPIKPSTSNRILIPDNCRLDLGDARLQVASDSPTYTYIISGEGGPSVAATNISVAGGEIDQNPTGHVLSAAQANFQFAILTYNCDGLTVDGVNFITGSANTIAATGAENVRNVRVNQNTFTFTKDSDTAYDNSAVYLHAFNVEANDNRFYSAHSELARGCIEIHSPLAVARGNRSWNYWTLFNLVSSGASLDGDIDRYLVDVSGNVGYGLRAGITIWPRSGTDYRGVSINDNQLYIQQVTIDEKDAHGIAFVAAEAFDGTVDGLHITDNQITFEDGDNRTVDQHGTTISHANTHAIHTAAHTRLRNAQIKTNTIVNAPQNGIYLGNNLFSGAEHENVLVEGNLQVNTGNNRAKHGATRSAFVFAGKFTNTRIRNNPVIVTDADGTSDDQHYSYAYTITSGGGNVFEDNPILVNGGYTLTEASISSVFALRRPVAATTLGSVTGKQEVFDRYGASLGFVPIYDAIT